MRAAALLLLSSSLAALPAPAIDSGAISGLGARNIGSAAMSGRISAVTGRVEESGTVTLFVGAASGGVWKSLDGGTTFKPVFDRQPVQSIGAIALDPSDPKVVWVGTGEAWTRNSVSVGDGIWRSGDGGETWTHMGLPESERVNRILVNPKKSDVVYACVPGQALVGLRRTAASTRRRTAGRAGRSSSRGRTSRRAAPASRWTRATRIASSPASGTSGGRAGRSARGATGRRGTPGRGSS